MTGNDSRDLRYVLSAGRTGTVFLNHLINESIDGVIAVHEPDVSRYQMMLANLRNDHGVGGGLLKRWFDRTQKAREAAADGVYVELNPFLCPMTDLIPRAGRPLRIVHLVRDPATWAASISAFKASSRFRDIIHWIPLAKPYPAPRPVGWTDLEEYERALWRWKWCNGRIEALKQATTSYRVIRFEDLTSPDAGVRDEALAAISETLALPGRLREDAADQLPTNPSVGSDRLPDRDAAARICGPIARAYGYGY